MRTRMRISLLTLLVGTTMVVTCAAFASGAVVEAFPAAETPPPQRIVYVDDNAGGTNDGSSWQNAYTRLQAALQAARPRGRDSGRARHLSAF